MAAEALDYHQLLRDLERGWLVARAAAAGRRSTSRAGLAIDVLAASPLLSATTLARAIGMSIKSATELLDGFLAEGIVAEVTHRSARRLFGLVGMAPVREVTQPPRRPEPGRGRGRPRLILDDEVLDLHLDRRLEALEWNARLTAQQAWRLRPTRPGCWTIKLPIRCATAAVSRTARSTTASYL